MKSQSFASGNLLHDSNFGHLPLKAAVISDFVGSILPSASQIMPNIEYTMEDKSERPPSQSHPLRYLTSQNHDIRAKTRDDLQAIGKLVCL